MADIDFSRKKLLGMIERGIAKHRAKYDQEETAKAEKRAAEAKTWERMHGSGWDEFLAKAAAARKAKQPITVCMTPKSKERYSCGDVAWYSASYPPKDYEPPNDLLVLKEMLEASTSETIPLGKLRLANIEMIAQGAVRPR